MYSMRRRKHVILYRAKQSLAIDCHTIQLPQFRDCMTHFLIAEFYPTVQLKYLPGTVKFCVDPVRLFGCIFIAFV